MSYITNALMKVDSFFRELFEITFSSPIGFVFGLMAFNLIGCLLMAAIGAIGSLF